MTVGSLDKPIELVQGVEFSATPGKRQSFAYLGPVEWDNMGDVAATGFGFIWHPETIGASTTFAAPGPLR